MTKRGPIIATWLSIAQGIVYTALGLWVMVARRSYLDIHELGGDFLLITMNGLWLLLVGLVLVIAGFRRAKSLEVRLLAFASALGLLLTYFISNLVVGVARIYYTDMTIESVFVILWIFVWTIERQGRRGGRG